MLRSLFSRPSPTVLQEPKNAPLQALECGGWRVLLLLFRFLKLSKKTEIQSLICPHLLFPCALPWKPWSEFPSPNDLGAGSQASLRLLPLPQPRAGQRQQWLLLPRSPKRVTCCNSKGLSLARSKSFVQGKISCSGFQRPSAPCQRAS